MDKDDFIKILLSYDIHEINRLLESKGQTPRPIEPMKIIP